MAFEFNSNNSYLFNINEFTDDNRVHYKKIQAVLKANPEINSSIIIKIIAPAIRSTEEGEIQHKFLRSSDGEFLSMKGDTSISPLQTNLITFDNYELITEDSYLLMVKEG